MKTIFGLYGAGGFGREVMPLVSGSLAKHPQAEVYFVETTPTVSRVNGYRVISEDEFFALDCDERLFNVAVGKSSVREALVARCVSRGAQPLSLQAPEAIAYQNSELGAGAILSPFSILFPNTRIGKFFHSNVYSYVGHDCVLGDYVTFAPNVHCNGNIHIGDHAYVGTGAMIRQGTPDKPLVIGRGAFVGMGAVVINDVPEGATVFGNPARPVAGR
jgi:sugar O-acyltransferase (sialic acid O-acetyltransferase NeuD family)